MDTKGLTYKRLSDAWTTLYDLSKQDVEPLSPSERGILMDARIIVNHFEIIFSASEKDEEFEAIKGILEDMTHAGKS